MSNIVKILGNYYSYNEKLEIQENFKRHIIKIEKSLQIWRMRDLSIVGKITVFKTLAISKIEHLALVKTIPNLIIQEVNKCNPKIKHDTLCRNYENSGFKNVIIMYKVISLQCSWIKRLYHNEDIKNTSYST